MTVIARCERRNSYGDRCVLAVHDPDDICTIYYAIDSRGQVFERLWSDHQQLQGAVDRAEKAEARVVELIGVLRVLRSGLSSDDPRIDTIDNARGQSADVSQESPDA